VGEPAAPLVGRQRERGLLDRALERAADGPQVALLLGEAGIGKTRLLTTLVEAATARGWRTATGACVHLSTGPTPWAPWAALLRRLERTGSAAAGALRRRMADGGAPPASVLEQLLDVVEDVAGETPLLLAVEDLHWADAASLDALAFLGRNLGPVPVLLAATSRTDTTVPVAARAVLAELRRDQRTTALELEPLDEQATLALAAALGAENAPAGLHLRTGGNPFWAVEVVRGGGRLPEHLADVLLSRLAGLPRDARAALDVLAVVGHELPGPLLGAAAGLAPTRLGVALRVLLEHRLASPGDTGWQLVHDLTGDAVRGAQLPEERAEVHRRIAEVLDADPDLLEAGPLAVALARVDHRAGARDRPGELRACAAAVPLALDRRAGVAALGVAERAVALWPLVPDAAAVSGRTRGALLHAVAEAAARTGDGARAVEAAEKALAEADPLDDVVAGEREEVRSRALWLTGRPQEAAGAADRAAALLADHPGPALLRAKMAQATARMLLGRDDDAVALAQAALPDAQGQRALAEQAQLHGVLGVSLTALGRADEGLPHLQRARRLAGAAGDPGLLCRVLVNTSHAHELLGDLDAAAGAAAEAAALQRVDRPVPAVRGLDRHRRAPAGLAHLRHQGLRVVVDPDAVQLPALPIDPDDHRPMQMQIDADPLRGRSTVAHRGPPLRTGVVSNPRIPREPTGAEAPPRYGITYWSYGSSAGSTSL
jgi:tetratricopeptide (TPR) repeat protein